MKKVAWLTSGFAPYRVPLWNALSEIVPTTVFLLTEQEKIRDWKRDDSALRVPVEVIRGRHLFFRRLDWGLNLSYLSVRESLTAFDPDGLIIGGYESPGFWSALHWAKARGRACVMHSGSTDLSTRTGGNRFIEIVKSHFIQQLDAYYTYGKYAADYLVRLGAKSDQIVIGQNVNDISLTPNCERIGDEEQPSLLYVGQLLPRKGVVEMVRALSGLKHVPWHCTIVGGGPQKQEIEDIVKAEGMEGRVILTGPRGTRETAAIYRQHDILIMPSLREVWGLVTNEALLSGLFVVGSTHAASCLELIRDGENGVLAEPTVEGLRAGIRRALEVKLPLREMNRASVLHVTPEGEAQKVYRALQLAEAHVKTR